MNTLWKPMETAPLDGSSVLLKIKDCEHPMHETDGGISLSIGAYAESGDCDNPEPHWVFAGWIWDQDCHSCGTGTPVAWMPIEELLNKETK